MWYLSDLKSPTIHTRYYNLVFCCGIDYSINTIRHINIIYAYIIIITYLVLFNNLAACKIG